MPLASSKAFFESCLVPLMLFILATWLAMPKPVGDYYNETGASYYTLDKGIASSVATLGLLERLEDSSMLELSRSGTSSSPITYPSIS